MKRSITVITVTAIAMLMASGALHAGVPEMINYQGRLTELDGTPINGSVSIVFTIYDMQSGGTSYWTETHAAVQVDDGLFSVILGSQGSPLTDTVFADPERYLGIAVNGDPEIDPRTRLVSAPYAHVASQSHVANSANSIDTPWEVTDSDPSSFGPIIELNQVWTLFEEDTHTVKLGQAWDALEVSTTGQSDYAGALRATYEGAAPVDIEARLACDQGVYKTGAYGKYESYDPHEWQTGYLGINCAGVFGRIFTESTEKRAVYGRNENTEIWGYLAGKRGAAGLHPCGNKGYLGGDSIGTFGHAETADDYAVLGENEATGCLGYLGYVNGVSGVHGSTGNGGYIGGSTMGAYGQALSGSSVGVKGEHVASGNSGYLGGENYAGYFDGDVGVGTDSPNGPLHVQSGISISTGSNYDSRIAPVVIGDGSGSNQCLLIDGNQVESSDNRDINVNAKSTGDVILAKGGGDVGIGASSPAYKLDVSGDIQCVQLHETSDVRYKTNIEPLADALRLIAQVRGVSFDWKTEEFPEHGFTDERQVGFIAQELQDILPELVSEDDAGLLSVDYTRMTPILVEAMKELKAENDELRDRLAKIEALLEQIADNQ